MSEPMPTALLNALTRLYDFHESITLFQAQCFVYIATHPGTTARQLVGELRTNDSRVSRTLALLSDLGVRNTPPLKIIQIKPSREDRRERLLFLTTKGTRLMEDIANDLRPHADEKDQHQD